MKYRITMTTGTGHCNAAQTLKKAGLAKTAQRMAVLEIMINTAAPLSAAEILARLKDRQKINRVTVYRIIASLREGGVIREIETDRGGNCYEMACQHNPVHPHFKCKKCGSMICMQPLTFSQAWEWFAKPYDFSIDSINITIAGTCNACGASPPRGGASR
ncbi:MAG: transcriptional repressor [Deltaproteobacteria bacterium]|nr:transcriptional repressor [Deltaproteobacteria bacterium]